MAAEQDDVIRHLLQIEDEASELVKEAQVEAEGIIAAAKARTDAQFKKEFETVSSEIEKNESLKRDNITASHKEQLQQYKDSLTAYKKDFDSFNSLMDSLLKA
ncbi:hypothetical protein [Treponema sp.]|uniref:hypothetical protein n=1 Tax=Treponema sp. TaxID=166 RepID=UPI002600FF90|nr:hypothetical protein [Treponema sp.]MCR5218792.1 hypothetical protein [Treponema sp.]